MSMDFLESVEEQLVAATERGISRRRWRWPWLMRIRVPVRAPSVGIAAGIGTALAASAIAATITIPGSRSKPRAQAPAAQSAGVRSYTTPGSVPIGFEPQSFTAITEFTWWLLGIAPCGGGHSCTTIVQTTDGGPQFTRIGAPPTTAVSQLRFADTTDGYAFGPQLWSTHDNGHSWTRQRLGGTVDQLATADGYAFAIVSAHRRSQLMRSAVGGDQWVALAGVGRGPLSGLWVEGQTVVLQSATRLLVSTDQGASFDRERGVRHAGDCSYDGGQYALWAVCAAGMAPDEILLSGDSGSTFTTAATLPNGPINSFAAADGDVAVASGQGPLYRTVNGGVSWSRVRAPIANWIYLGFSDPTHGVAIGAFGDARHQRYRLYYTTDAGRSYHRVPIRP